MSQFVILLVAAPLLARQADQHSPYFTPSDVAAGAKTFRSHCAPCHGYNGEGGRGPNLAAAHFYHGSTDLELFNNISNGIPGTDMPGDFYSADRIWQIVAFIRTLHAVSEKPIGDAERGARIYEQQACARCHRIDGQGSGLGPDLSQIGASRSPEFLRNAIINPNDDVQPRYWRAKFTDSSGKAISGFVMNEDTYTVQILDMNGHLHTYQKERLTNYRIDKQSVMPSFRSLKPEQIDDLVAYLWTRRPQ
jgi:putative heme-binding domain-containing protein